MMESGSPDVKPTREESPHVRTGEQIQTVYINIDGKWKLATKIISPAWSVMLKVPLVNFVVSG